MATRPLRADLPAAHESLLQAAKFTLVGVSNTAVDVGLYFLLSSGALGVALPGWLAKMAAYLAGVLNSFTWNRRWTFRSTRPASRTLPPFLLTNLAGLGLNVALLQGSLAWLQLPEPAALVLATIGAILWNFLVNKFWVFKPHDKVEA